MGATAAIVVSALGAAMSYKSQKEAAGAQRDAAREAQQLAEMNAVSSERETAQEAENLSRMQDKEQAANRAKAAASGVTGEGSFGMVMDEQKDIHGQELDWLKQSGRSKAGIIRKGGQNAYSQGMAQSRALRARANSTLISGAGSFARSGAEQEWF